MPKAPKININNRFGFLVSEVGRLYGRQFDQLSRQKLGLSRAQCRLIAILALHTGDVPLRQTELADRMELTTMGVASLCKRLEAGGWVTRTASPSDARANEIVLQPKAHAELQAALAISDKVQAQALQGLSAEQRTTLMELLRQVHGNLTAL
jgi:DNA-binding MarR family transcriptional regulator